MINMAGTILHSTHIITLLISIKTLWGDTILIPLERLGIGIEERICNLAKVIQFLRVKAWTGPGMLAQSPMF